MTFLLYIFLCLKYWSTSFFDDMLGHGVVHKGRLQRGRGVSAKCGQLRHGEGVKDHADVRKLVFLFHCCSMFSAGPFWVKPEYEQIFYFSVCTTCVHRIYLSFHYMSIVGVNT